MAQQPLVEQRLLIIEDTQSHSKTLLWTTDQPEAETSTSQYTTLARDKTPFYGGIRTHNPSNRTVADRRLRQRGIFFFHWIWKIITSIGFSNFNDTSVQLISI